MRDSCANRKQKTYGPSISNVCSFKQENYPRIFIHDKNPNLHWYNPWIIDFLKHCDGRIQIFPYIELIYHFLLFYTGSHISFFLRHAHNKRPLFIVEPACLHFMSISVQFRIYVSTENNNQSIKSTASKFTRSEVR